MSRAGGYPETPEALGQTDAVPVWGAERSCVRDAETACSQRQIRIGQSRCFRLAEHGYVGSLGLGLLAVESVVLSGQGIQHGAVSLIAVLAASTVSSIAGFAFSALCGALLFHVMESPVYAVEVIDRLQYCDPGAQRGCALALNRLAQS